MLRFLVLVLLAAAMTTTAGTPVTIHVDDAYIPYSFSDNGTPKGIYIDVLKAAFAKMDDQFTVTLVPVPWTRGKKMMEEGTGYGLTPAFFHGHDWPYLYPYSLPFYTETIQAICTPPTLDTARANWPDDYIGLRIGNVKGFDGWGGEKFHQLVKDGQIKYQEAKGSEANLLKLVNNRVDCIMMEIGAYHYELERLNAIGKLKGTAFPEPVIGALVGEDPVYIGYSKAMVDSGKVPHHRDFMQAFDSIIYQMGKSGEIEKIMRAYQ